MGSITKENEEVRSILLCNVSVISELCKNKVMHIWKRYRDFIEVNNGQIIIFLPIKNKTFYRQRRLKR